MQQCVGEANGGGWWQWQQGGHDNDVEDDKDDEADKDSKDNENDKDDEDDKNNKDDEDNKEEEFFLQKCLKLPNIPACPIWWG